MIKAVKVNTVKLWDRNLNELKEVVFSVELAVIAGLGDNSLCICHHGRQTGITDFPEIKIRLGKLLEEKVQLNVKYVACNFRHRSRF